MRRKGNRLVGLLRTCDDVTRLAFGMNLPRAGGRIVDLFFPDLIKKVTEGKTDETDPYYILGIHRGAKTFVVKAAFRSAAREYHPDTGSHPNPTQFQKVKEAYDKIMAERNAEGSGESGGL